MRCCNFARVNRITDISFDIGVQIDGKFIGTFVSMRRISIVLGLVIAIIISSCSIKQNIHFNNDWSGSLKYDIDMGSLKSMLDDDTTGTAGNLGSMMDGDFGETIKELQASSGLTNIIVTEDTIKGTIHMSMDFKDLETLNEVMSGTGLGNVTGESSVENHVYFKLKKNKLTYAIAPVEPNSKGGLSGGMEGVEGMMSMMKFQLTFSFDREIKKVKTKTTASKSGSNNEVVWNPDFQKLANGKIVGNIIIVLEK